MFKDFVRNIPLSESSLYDNTNLSRIKRRFNNMLQDKWGREKTPDPLHPSKVNRHAKSREPGKLVTGHFWRKIRSFFWNHSIKEINLRVCFGFVKKWFKWKPVSLHFYPIYHYVYSYNPLFCKFFQINCSDISRSQSRFPDKNIHFVCLKVNYFVFFRMYPECSNLRVTDWQRSTNQFLQHLRPCHSFVFITEVQARNNAVLCSSNYILLSACIIFHNFELIL